MEAPAYSNFGGKHPETAALKNVLAYHGLDAPHTGQPFTEEMLFGIGGGIGVTYFTFEFAHGPFMVLGTAYPPRKGEHGILQAACERLGVGSIVKESGGAKAAEAHLKSALTEGYAVITLVDVAMLPYHALPPELAKYFGYTVVVYAIDEATGMAYVADRSNVALTLTAQELAAARSSITSQKNRIIMLEAPTEEIDLQRAISQGIEACCRGMLEPPIANFGLKGLQKWSDLVANPKDKKGWPTLFAHAAHLYDALTWVFTSVELFGTGGSGMRSMYAAFLDEAGDALGSSSLKAMAEQYDQAAWLWSALAAAALPNSVPPLRRTRQLLTLKAELFEEQGGDALPEILKINEELAEIKREAVEEFARRPNMAQGILADLRHHIEGVYQAEEQASMALKAAIASPNWS
ncbi:MAG TPA: DUF4872 domain-containing protein [Chloroflexia bacterium]|nr:DUF4872 domain-containing protein [Chloroflexia bacterium]